MTNIAHLPSPERNDGNSTVAANIRAEIAYAGSTQGELARAIGMTGMSLSRRLRNETEFTATHIVAIAEHFGIEPGELFMRRHRPVDENTKKAPTPKGEGQGAGAADFTVEARRFGLVTQLPIRSIVDAVERDELAEIHTLRSAS